MSAPNPRIFLQGFLLIAILVVIATLFEISPLSSLLDKAWVDSDVRGKGASGELIFLAMAGLAVAIGVPRQIISFLAGYAFNVALGVVFGVVATVLGCLLSFFFARWFGRALLPARLTGRCGGAGAFIHDNTLSMTVLLRLLPVGNNLMLNLAAGVSAVRAWPFVTGSALGYIPQTLVFALVGSGINVDPVLRIGLGLALLLVSGMLGIYLFRKFRQGRQLDAQIEQELGVYSGSE